MEFKQFLDKYKGKELFIQTHNFPDPDALGSAYALKRLCENFGVSATLCYDGKIDKLSTLRFLSEFNVEISPKNEIKNMNQDSPIILVDTQKSAGNVTDLIGDEIACIDHHPTVVDVEYEYMDVSKVGACCSIIAEYYKELEIMPDTITATALLYGIKMDTNNFSRGVTERDIQAYAYLNPMIDSELLQRVLTNTMEFSDLTAYGAAFESIRVYDKVGIAYIPFSCAEALIAMISDFILALEEVEFAIVYAKRENDWKFSVRSETSEYDAGDIIRKALDGIGNGGGHACMAGGLIPLYVVNELGNNADTIICNRFLDVMKLV